MSTAPSLTIIIPAYNEATRVGATLHAIDAYLGEGSIDAEIIVIDDGSFDDTFDVVSKVAGNISVPLRLLRYEINRGKGFALKQGFAVARGRYVLFTDADLATPIEQLPALLGSVESGSDIAIGSRNLSESCINIAQPWYRVLMGKINLWLVRRIAIRVSDATCGFKMFRGDVGQDIFARVRVSGFGFDAESLFIAKALGYSIAEIPVLWENKAGTSVSVVRDTVDTLVGLSSIRWNAMVRRYASASASDCEIQIWSNNVEKRVRRTDE